MDGRAGLLGPVDPDVIAGRTAGCPSVARLSPGPLGEVATYLPGRRVPGVRLPGDRIEIHVVARWGIRVPDVAAEVRAAVGPVSAGLPIDVHVDDVDIPAGADGLEIHLPDSDGVLEA
jgi:hypothetical protein